jgi:hypothetical protein
VDSPERLARWRPLVQWIMAIPHFVILYALNVAAEVIALISWFAIVFTGRLPEGFANFQCLVLRYQMRVQLYAGFLHESYPPFEFEATPGDTGGQPIAVDLRPALGGRNRLTVGLRLIWMIPALLYVVVIAIAAAVCWFLAFFAVLFTGKWPHGMHGFIVKSSRVSLRFGAYLVLLTDEYPPFSLD